MKNKSSEPASIEEKPLFGFNEFIQEIKKLDGGNIVFDLSVSFGISTLYSILDRYCFIKPRPDKFPIPCNILIEKTKRSFTKFVFNTQLDLQRLNNVIFDMNFINIVIIDPETSKISISIKNNLSRKIADNNVPEL